MLLHAWYCGSQPARRRWLRRAAAAGRVPLSILFYHRVANEHPNLWTCSTDTFRAQLDWLAAHVELVGLEEIQRRIGRGANDRPVASLTFDDGYADNCQTAIGLLIQRRIPCTYFVSVGNVLHGQPFPHDVAAGTPLAPNSLSQLRSMAEAGIEIGAHTYSHADVGRIYDQWRLYKELVVAKRHLEDALGRPVRYFAFPYGMPENMTPQAFDLAREAGYAGVCSAYGAYNWPGDDPFHLRRIHADNDLIRLKNWLTFDPRKLRGGAVWSDQRADAGPAAALPEMAATPLEPSTFAPADHAP